MVHVLLVTTLANGIFAAVEKIKENPNAIMEMLATTLPQASTFFLSFILVSLIKVPMMLLQIGPLIMHWVNRFLATTPRKVYAAERTMGFVDWGMTVPVHTIAFAIGKDAIPLKSVCAMISRESKESNGFLVFIVTK